MSYTIVRQRRKTCAIYVRSTGVEVRAPLRMPLAEIDSFVASKQDWIARKFAEAAAQAVKKAGFTLEYGDSLLYRGREYPIVSVPGKRMQFNGEAFRLPKGLSAEALKAACVQLYRALARERLTRRVAELSQEMGVVPASIRINGATTRWGSCSSKKSLNFSWRLVMASDEVIDYVVVHELAHLTEMNHSPRFWKIVQGVLPDYQDRRMLLRNLQDRLRVENWES